MNEKKRLQLYHDFSHLSDKDLAIIELSHGPNLTKEARQAIDDIISKRDPASYQKELEALAEQAAMLFMQHEKKLKRRKDVQEKKLRKLLMRFIYSFLFIGAVFALTGYYATAMANGIIALVIFLYIRFS